MVATTMSEATQQPTENAAAEASNATNADPQPATQSGTAAAAAAQAAQSQAAYHSASLYVGDLHPEVTEALLFDIFNAVGPVASIRVCRDAVTRRSLGYAYVNFHNVTDAERALDTMNYTTIKDRPCRIMWSQRDPSLRKTGQGNVFVKNLDLSIDNKALYDTFSLFGDILSCKVVTDKEGNSLGHGFVHFQTVEAADEAIKKINGMLIAGQEVFVGHFQKRSERAGATQWTNLYVKNVPKHWNEGRLNKLFEAIGPVASIAIMKDEEGKSKGFGFVDFAEHEHAAEALESLQGKEFAADEESEKLAAEIKEKGGEAAAPAEAAKADEDKKEKDDEADKDKENGADKDAGNKEGAEVVEDPNKPRMLKLYISRAQKKSERDRELSERFEQLKLERHNKYQGVNLYVKNLAEDVTDEIIHKEFSQFGSITSVRVMREPIDPKDPVEETEDGEKKPRIGVSKGFGFVCFSSSDEAMRALTEMQGHLVHGKPLFVALAQRKDTRRAHLEAQHQRRTMGRGVPGMQPGMYPGAPMYAMGGMAPGGMMPPGAMMPPNAMSGPRGFGYMQTMPMGAARGMPAARGMYPGAMGGPGQGFVPQMGGPMGQPMGQPMNPGAGGGRGGRGGRGRGRGGVKPGQQIPGGAPQGQPGGFQYNSNVRNHPMQGGQPMPPGGMPPQMQPPVGQQPQQQAPQMQQQMTAQAPGPLTAAALANADVEEQKNMIGERLYPLIQRQQPELAGKITGMLLEIDNVELLHLLESESALKQKINEAVLVLQQHGHPQ